jgi:hypothetical protein
MTYQQLRSWIRQDLLELSAQKFPNNPRLQMLYQIGFLQTQLAQSMNDDSRVSQRFMAAYKQAVNKEAPL